MNVAFPVVGSGVKMPSPPLTTVHWPVPFVGVLPPSPAVVPPVQIVCGVPVMAVDGGCLIVMVTFAKEAAHGARLIVHRTITGPAPPVWVKVAFGAVLFGLKVPVPPLTTLQVPVPDWGLLPPSPVVEVLTQIVCGPPTVAAVGWGFTRIWMLPTASVPQPLLAVTV